MYELVSSTTPYGSLATIVQSSARPMNMPWPLPRRARKIVPGASALATPMATDPSNALTVRRNASTGSTPVAR